MSQFQPPIYPQRQEPPYSSAPKTYYPPQPLLPPTQPVPPQKKRMRRRHKIALGFIASLIAVATLIVAVIFMQPGATPAPAPAIDTAATATAQDASLAATNTAFEETATANQQATQAASTPSPVATTTNTPTPAFLTFGDGTYQVGTDIKPGTYRTQSGSTGCYYERLKGFSGTDSDILANNLTDYPAIVTILPTDKGFTSKNCGTWTSDLSQITTSKTTFSDGMYIVGTDIAPGTYKNTASQGCYYARLSGFDNTDNAILANNLTDNTAIVTISASDKGFESHNCGIWTKI